MTIISNSDYIASDGMVISELEMMCKEVAVA